MRATVTRADKKYSILVDIEMCAHGNPDFNIHKNILKLAADINKYGYECKDIHYPTLSGNRGFTAKMIQVEYMAEDMCLKVSAGQWSHVQRACDILVPQLTIFEEYTK